MVFVLCKVFKLLCVVVSRQQNGGYLLGAERIYRTGDDHQQSQPDLVFGPGHLSLARFLSFRHGFPVTEDYR